jgi:hypothetical protein
MRRFLGSRVSDTWECRFVVTELPPKFLPPALSSLLPSGYEVLANAVRETDDYLLASSHDLNVKIRHRSRSVKLKSLRGTTSDRLECWRTDFKHRLPAPARVWGEILRLLDCRMDCADLAGEGAPDAVIELLRRCLAPERTVRADKLRSIYGDGTDRLEIAQFVTRNERFATVCIEGDDPGRVREVLKQLATAELGRPRNSIEVLHDLTAG